MQANQGNPGMQLASLNRPYTNDIGNMAQTPEPQLNDPKTLSTRIQQWLGAKQPDQGGSVQDILAQRFQPNLDDTSQAAVQTLFKGEPVSGQNIADTRAKDAIDRLSTLSRAQYLAKGGGSGSVFSQTMQAINSDPSLTSLPLMDKIRLAQNKLGTNLTIGADGAVNPLTGAPAALGQLKLGEESGRQQAVQNYAAPIKVEEKKGEIQGQQLTNLPVLEQNTAYAQKLLSDIVFHPGLQYAQGAGSLLPTVPGTPQADFKALRNQINGISFLQAFSTLRGGGQISNIEGEKATGAITRMNDPKTSPEAFKAAANELYNILQIGMERAKGEAGGNFNQNFNQQDFGKTNTSLNPTSGSGGVKFLGFE